MLRFVARRLALLVLMLGGLIVITFVVSNIAPADPAALAAGPDATRDMIETVRHEYGLDQPLPMQFLRYVSDLLHGNLGRAIQTGDSVSDDLARYFPATLELVLLSTAFAVIVGVGFGILAAVRRNRLFDHAARIFAVSGVALPAFWAALLLQLVFGVYLGWLPTSGQLSVATAPPDPITGMVIVDALLRGQLGVAGEAFRYAILPAFVLALPSIAAILRVNRAEMIEVLNADYVTAARAHGVGTRRVIGWLALKNAMLPTLAMIGLRLGWTLGSTFLVETVFDWPGIGLYAVSSALASDFKPVMGVTLIIGITFMLSNLLIDLAYGWLDPRTRTA
ncbi:MAG TPA: ABC transporter permease [Acetobacteraceae bacterium]|jgi:peptide/nickel transport system permease protein|nr:ABC transporter permease [Acetobacteraceae bacterium]